MLIAIRQFEGAQFDYYRSVLRKRKRFSKWPKADKDLNLDDDPIRNEDITRAMMKVGQIRRIEDVRLNRDRNLLIVSDEYDYNTDLRPFLLKIKNSKFKLFSSQYTDTLSSKRI